MANLIRRNQGEQPMANTWDPYRLMREMLSWDPFAEMVPTRQLATFAPQFEVKETRDGYLFKADVPGIDEKDLDITLTGSRLTVSGKREAEERQESETYYAFERSYGTFTRSFTLPEGVDADNVNADVKNGVLTISIPKKPEHQPRKISLKGLGEKVRGALGGKEKAST
jgi:HSP20 family protein